MIKTLPEAIAYIFIFAFAAAVGSFLNVCICRIPIGKSIISPGSRCPSCACPILFYDNIPVVSYILLLGRCRRCRERISFEYPFVEVLTGFMALFLYGRFGLTPIVFVYFLLIASLIVITFIDLSHRIIPDVISLPGIAAGIILSGLLSYPAMYPGVIDSRAGILAGGGILLIISVFYSLLTGHAGMGGGDVKLLAMVGAFLGWRGVFFTLFAGSLAGAAMGLILMLFWGKKSKYAVPFGPFLSFGAAAYTFYGREVINWYISGVWRI
ncbi:MAG: prepilin peptidase [Deltaproteobacteria bacterium]|nr:prepilin peptidase [Deltaproteobacteria bacterium]